MTKGITSASKRLIAYLADRKHIHLYIMALGLLCAVLFCFAVYPNMQKNVSSEDHLDPDQHGNLAYGIMFYHTFSYYPDNEPTVERGPFYPAFIAALLLVTHDWWPYSVQLGQCILFALMCGLVFYISDKLWGRRVAVVTSVISAVHPLAIWYTSRIWIETMSMLLFMAILAGMLYVIERPTLRRALLLGGALAAASLTKSTFVPYILVAPVLVWLLAAKEARLRTSIAVFLVSVLLVAPWTVRNLKLTGRFIPVHARLGYNMEMGDELVERWSSSPLCLAEMWGACMLRTMGVEAEIPNELPKWRRELLMDDRLMAMSMERYRANPIFMLKKMAINGIMFWTVGSFPGNSLMMSAALLPLLLLVVISTVILWRRRQILSIMGAHLLLMFLYYAMHLPVEAIARYSVVLLPAMIMYGIGPIVQSLFEDKR